MNDNLPNVTPSETAPPKALDPYYFRITLDASARKWLYDGDYTLYITKLPKKDSTRTSTQTPEPIVLYHRKVRALVRKGEKDEDILLDKWTTEEHADVSTYKLDWHPSEPEDVLEKLDIDSFRNSPRNRAGGEEVAVGDLVTVVKENGKVKITKEDTVASKPDWYRSDSVNISNQTAGQPIIWDVTEKVPVAIWGPVFWVPGQGRIKLGGKYDVRAWFENETEDRKTGITSQDFSNRTNLSFAVGRKLSISYLGEKDTGWSTQDFADLTLEDKQEVEKYKDAKPPLIEVEKEQSTS